MKTFEEISQLLIEKFGESNLIVNDTVVDKSISVSASIIKDFAAYLKENELLKFDSLMLLSGVDDANEKTIKNEDGSTSVEGGTFSVYYHLESYTFRHKLVIKVSVDKNAPEVPSVTEIWPAADWHEREAFDLIGINFTGHPDLRRILMPYDWEGFPLRKDYKNPEFYQGIKVPF